MTEPYSSEISQVASLQDKVVLLVTGARIGGQSLAVSLAERGADIAIVCLRDQHRKADQIRRQVEEKGRRCLTIPVEKEGKALSRRVIEQIVEQLGRLDIFIDYTSLPDVVSGNGVEENEQQSYWSNPFSNFEIMAAALRQMVDHDQPRPNDY